MEMRLRFSNQIDRRLSRIQLVASDGTSADLPVASSQAPDVIVARAKDLPPGDYLVRWQVANADGRITQLDIPVGVRTRSPVQ